MKLDTRQLGEIEINEQDILDFGYGILGFPDDRYFVLLAQDEEEEDNSVYFLQSVDDVDVSFVLIDMVAISPDYNPFVEGAVLEGLGQYTSEDFCVYNIATIYDDLGKSTVNLKAPIVINTLTKRASQVVCISEDYSVKAPLIGDTDTDTAYAHAQEVGEVC